MLDELQLVNLPSGQSFSRDSERSDFLLKTCQRTLVLSMDDLKSDTDASIVSGTDAYNMLLQIICGLQSKLVGENEIVNQFKLAYKEYAQDPQKCTRLLLILEKLFKDAKEIRSKYLLGLSQKTYSSLTRKHILGRYKADSVLILGSGQLAEDLINQFKKKSQVYISARNTEKAIELAKTHNIEIVEWKNYELYKKFPYIANTIGTDKEILFNEAFFYEWNMLHGSKTFVDLGSPSCIKTNLTAEDDVLRLKEIFSEGAIHEEHKLQQIEKAKIALNDIVSLRHKVLLKRAQKAAYCS